MIIYGSRMYGKKDVVRGQGYCDHCGKFDNHESYYGRKFGHIYFIPLIPSGPRMRVIKECKKCSNGIHIPETEVPELVENLKKQSDESIAALLSGKISLEPDGEEVHCAEMISGNIDPLMSLNEEEYVKHSLEAMRQKELFYAYHLAKAEREMFKGELQSAAGAYQNALDVESERAAPLFGLGYINLKNGEFQKARAYYERIGRFPDQRSRVLPVLLQVYEGLNEYELLVDAYGACFEVYPDMLSDKATKKAYKRACKKAGRAVDNRI